MPDDQIFSWSDEQRRVLDAILDQLIPASADGNIPAAGALGVAEFLAAQVASSVATENLFKRGLASVGELAQAAGGSISQLSDNQQRSVVEQLEQQQPEFFQTLLRHTYMGYYSDARIRPLFGLSADPPQPGGYMVPVDDPEQLEALVAPVRRRGNCFRQC